MIYFIQAKHEGGPIKIGYSDTPEYRLGSIQTGNPYELCVIGAIPGKQKDERYWHNKLGGYRLKGEWFKPAPYVIRMVAQAIESQTSDCLKVGKRVDQWIKKHCSLKPKQHPLTEAQKDYRLSISLD